MDIKELAIEGSFSITPKQLADPRGVFLELFKRDPFVSAVGHPFTLVQANCSVSAKGVLRGIHFAAVPPGQAKYITCLNGSVLDVVVDIRVGSPTFGQWDSELLDTVDRRAVYLAEGLGHAFVSLEDNSTVMYLCSEGYAPGREFGINPLDPAIGVQWPDIELHLSDKDVAAPSLVEAQDQGLLPTLAQCQTFISTLS